MTKAQIKYYKKNKQKVIKAAKIWSEQHPEVAKRYYKNNYKQILAYHRQWNSKNKRKKKEYSYKWKEKLRSELLKNLGSKCACCNETIREFLTVDHIHGGGSQHRKKLNKSGSGNMWLAVRREEFPKRKYRILCMNCNFVTRYGVICPHQR